MHEQSSSNTRNPMQKRAGFSHQLLPCCIQGTPCCAVILALQVPFIWGRIVVCQAIGRLIGGVRGTGFTQSVYHRSLLSFHGIYIHPILLVTSWNRAVIRHGRTAPAPAKGTLLFIKIATLSLYLPCQAREEHLCTCPGQMPARRLRWY